MPNSLIINGEIVLEGAIMRPEYVHWYESGVFSSSMVREALAEFDGDVTIKVNSAGGDAVEGEAIRAVLDDFAGTVTVKVAGLAASAASLMIMSADMIEVSAGSMMMIHDPSSVTWGNAAEHYTTFERLTVLSNTYASVYATRSGKSDTDVREMMQAETWMGPKEAIQNGFADKITGQTNGTPDDLSMNAAMMSSAAEQHSQAIAMMADAFMKNTAALGPIPSHQPGATGNPLMATMAATEGASMPPEVTPTNPATPAPVAVAADPTLVATTASSADILRVERERSQSIMSAARPFITSGQIDLETVEVMIADGTSVEMATTSILTNLADGAGQQPVEMRTPAGATRVGREDCETRDQGLELAMAARISGDDPTDDRAHPYMGLSIVEMAATHMGQDRPNFGNFVSRERVLMQAMHTGSDFPNLLSGAINRVIEANYDLIERSFPTISREMVFNDFREHAVIRPDEFPELQKITESGEIKFGTMGDSKEGMVLGSYATGIWLSRQLLVNDDTGAIADVINNASAVVPEFEEQTFWAMFNSNVVLGDGVAMFHADHGNLAASGTGITEDALSAGRKAMRQQKAADKKRTITMNGPSILVCGPNKETQAEKMLAQVGATKSDDVNIFSGKLSLLVTESITNNAWYLLVDKQKRTHNFKHGYLDGARAPRVRVNDPFGKQGMGMTLEHDFAAGGVNSRGAYKNAGA